MPPSANTNQITLNLLQQHATRNVFGIQEATDKYILTQICLKLLTNSPLHILHYGLVEFVLYTALKVLTLELKHSLC